MRTEVLTPSLYVAMRERSPIDEPSAWYGMEVRRERAERRRQEAIKSLQKLNPASAEALQLKRESAAVRALERKRRAERMALADPVARIVRWANLGS